MLELKDIRFRVTDDNGHTKDIIDGINLRTCNRTH